jgi:NAD(P)-dependent dehydrogenase (short-subunit alcohol dehydrogenase family)
MSQGGQRVALVTGASSGIGRACAVYLAQQGLHVYGTSRRAPLDQKQTSAGQVALLAVDVTSDQSVMQGVESVLTREGRLDILVNNAGMGIAGAVESTSIEEAQRQFDVNFFGVLRACRAVLPVMREQGAGYIVNIGSIGGVIAIPYQAMYSASKFALEGLSEALRLEVAPLGIRVVVIEPGDYKTSFTENRQFTKMSGEDGIYRPSFLAATERMARDEQGGPPPQQVARLLYRIVNARNPRLRYTIGPPAQRAAVWLKRIFPYRLLERGMRTYYGINY